MDIKQFVSEYEVDKGRNLIDPQMLEKAEQAVGIQFGEELTEYILKYGYLGYKHVELYGINSKQGLDSDLVQQTLYLHKYFSKTVPFVAVENQGEGDYFLINKEDEVFEYDSELNELKTLNLKLFSYILRRFESTNE